MTAIQTSLPLTPPHARFAVPVWGRHLLLAAVLTVILSASWTIKNWDALWLLRLPDNDDMMRLAQVRDWLNGQAFNDLTQYRLGPPDGASMHWSRIADAGPAALILLLTPVLGVHGAEVAMAISYVAILFFIYLLLVARISRTLGGPAAGTIGLLLAAVAFPTISLFVPGRIDHHALQIVLTLTLVDTMVAPASFRRGVIAGVTTALSLAIGLEAAPEIVAALAAIGLLWLINRPEENRRAIGFGVALGGATLAMLIFMRPMVWTPDWCDGLTPASTNAALVLGGAWIALGLVGRHLGATRARVIAAIAIGAAAAAAVTQTSAVCLAGPYDALHPFLKTVWMSNVSEAKDLFFGQDTMGTVVAYGGLMFAGLGVALLTLRRLRFQDWPWNAFALFLMISTIAAVLQVRITYIVAGIAAVPFAVAIAHAHSSGAAIGRRLSLWVLGAGVTYNVLGLQMDRIFDQPITAARVSARACTEGEPIQVPARQPVGTVMAPLDLGSYLTGLTPHHVVAAGYHRNNIGNLAMYRFFLAPPDAARQMARQWGIDYVALCPENLREASLARYRPGTLIETLQEGPAIPAWLEPVPTGGSLQFYRVRPEA